MITKVREFGRNIKTPMRFSGDLLIMNTVVIIRVVKYYFTVGMGK